MKLLKMHIGGNACIQRRYDDEAQTYKTLPTAKWRPHAKKGGKSEANTAAYCADTNGG